VAFRKSRWFTRGWTLQELIAPSSVTFFSKEWIKVGSRRSLEQHIYEAAGLPLKVLHGHPLSDFSIHERMVWAEKRETTRGEDKAYSLLGIFDVTMPLIYGEGRERAFRRLREAIDKSLKGKLFPHVTLFFSCRVQIQYAKTRLLMEVGTRYEDFAVPFSLSGVSEIKQFVAREEELAEIHAALSPNDRRSTVVLNGLGGIGKTQLSVAYTKRHTDAYSAIFWLNTKDEDSVKQSFVKLARQILREHPAANQLSSVDMDGELDEVVEAVKAWLSLRDNNRWLMVYDNYDNPKVPGNKDPTAVDILKYFPDAYQGSVIITTRSSKVQIGHLIRIRKLENVSDSLEILSNASGQEGLINGENLLHFWVHL
jgi:hypothetical protein